MRRLENKVALITGAARGIGRGIAQCFAEEGAHVVINDLPPGSRAGQADAAETAAEIAALGQRAMAHYADITDRDAVAAMFAAAEREFGQIDIVVANAAFSIRKTVVESAWEDVLRTLEVTQFGVYHTCQAAARHMVARGGPGKIIIIGSLLAKVAVPTSSAYNMAKAAVNHFGRTLANELTPQRINVNIINPGYIDTPGERAFASEEQIQKAGAALPWGRMGQPNDIGKAAAFLASADADYITGTDLLVDGGLSLNMRMPG